MAVYTQVSAEAMAALLSRYDMGTLVSAKGIAEGVENSNYLVETTAGRFILTLYEKRVKEGDLPYFINLQTHLADQALPVPRPVRDRQGETLQRVAGRPACLIEFLTGTSPSEPSPAQCHAAARALGRMHGALRSFAPTRPNAMGPADWRPLADACRAGGGAILPRLPEIIDEELAFVEAHWPHHLERSTIHADLFPDNVLMLGDTVTGLIDFYFACTDLRAYDLAVMHVAWCFDTDSETYFPERAVALRNGYLWGHPFQPGGDIDWFAVLCRGACLRFILSRTYDWINTPADALVTRKNPIDFVKRLAFYRETTGAEVLGY